MNINNLSDEIVFTLKIPCKGDHGNNLIKSIKTSAQKSLPEKIWCWDQIKLPGTKLSSQFNIKYDTNQKQNDLFYIKRCPPTICTDNYIGKAARV